MEHDASKNIPVISMSIFSCFLSLFNLINVTTKSNAVFFLSSSDVFARLSKHGFQMHAKGCSRFSC
jgi:hypothetical protein